MLKKIFNTDAKVFSFGGGGGGGGGLHNMQKYHHGMMCKIFH